jgi:uncharacterized BrkB/YihY/UPF0761 family membrane protein
MFLWLLPFTLLTVVGFGFLAEAGGSDPADLAKTAGIRGIASQSIAQATSSSTQGRWLLLGVGLIALLSTSRSLLKALWRCNELAWHLPRTKPPAGPKAVGALIGIVSVAMATSTGVAKLRETEAIAGLGAILLAFAVWGGLFLLASLWLPRAEGTSWISLLPGAILFGTAAEALRIVTVYYVAGKVGSSSALYGGLGAAAALLTWFFLVARTTVGGAVLNSTLWNRRCRGTESGFRRHPVEAPAEQ